MLFIALLTVEFCCTIYECESKYSTTHIQVPVHENSCVFQWQLFTLLQVLYNSQKMLVK